MQYEGPANDGCVDCQKTEDDLRHRRPCHRVVSHQRRIHQPECGGFPIWRQLEIVPAPRRERQAQRRSRGFVGDEARHLRGA